MLGERQGEGSLFWKEIRSALTNNFVKHLIDILEDVCVRKPNDANRIGIQNLCAYFIAFRCITGFIEVRITVQLDR